MTTTQILPIPGVTAVGSFQGPITGSVNASPTDGTFTIDIRDLRFALGAGYVPVYKDCRVSSPMVSPAAAAATSGRTGNPPDAVASVVLR